MKPTKPKQPKITIVPSLFDCKPLPTPAIPNMCHRPGAFDFMKYPSRMSESTVAKHDPLWNSR